MKAITILGSTGSIGTQTLDIVIHNPDKFRVVGLAAGSNITLLAEQIRTFKPKIVALVNEAKLAELKEAIASGTAKVGTVDDLIADLSEAEDEGCLE